MRRMKRMSGRGERPELDGEESPLVRPGQTVYTRDGTAIGDVRGLDRGGMFVSVRDGIESLSIEHARSGQCFGEAELVWRCMDCGEMGELAGGLPDACPGCGTSREGLMYWTED